MVMQVMAGCASCRTKDDFLNLGLSTALMARGDTIPRPDFGQCLGRSKNENGKTRMRVQPCRLFDWTV